MVTGNDNGNGNDSNDDGWGTPVHGAHWDETHPRERNYINARYSNIDEREMEREQQQQQQEQQRTPYTRIYYKNQLQLIIITGNRDNFKYVTGMEGTALYNLENMFKVRICVPKKDDIFNCIIISYDYSNQDLAGICAQHIRDIIDV